jgi:hypothetical protein
MTRHRVGEDGAGDTAFLQRALPQGVAERDPGAIAWRPGNFSLLSKRRSSGILAWK